MNPRILIHQLTLRGGGDEQVVQYSFGPGVNVVVGGVGTGKTSMLRAIKWNLGGNAARSSAVRSAVQTSELDIELNDSRYRLTRYADRTDLDIVDYASGELLTRARAAGARSGAPVSISDFLLDQLAIPRIALPRARSRARREQTSVSFWDVLDYVFVSQSRMDNSIVYHNNPVRDPKRRATFELLYGLLDEDLAALERTSGELKSELLETKSRVKGIRAFIDGGETAPESVLRLEAERLDVLAAEAERRVAAIRTLGRSAAPQTDGLRLEVLEQEAAVSGLHLKEREAATEIGRYEALVAQLELDLDRLERGDVAAQILTPFEFGLCPRCGQHLSRVAADGDCLLCLQPEPQTRDEASSVAEHARITAQLAETVALLQDAEFARDRTTHELVGAKTRLRDLHRELDAQLHGFVSREYAEIVDATRSLAETTARQGAVSSLIAMHDRYHRESEAIPRLEAELLRVAGELAASRAELGAARQKIQRLSEMFDQLLRAFRYPWYPSEGAWIDPETYLPVVGSDTFAEASSGMQTLLNVAYHLAGLRFGLQEDDSLVPLFLVLDSPRKNIGTINDQGIGQQIYGRLRVLQDSYPDRFQMIVADNDPPPFAPDFAPVTLTYERPFIPWVEHPGEGRVEPIEV